MVNTTWLYYNRLMRVWGTWARTEGGVFMYLSKQSEDHRPKTLMSQGGTKFAQAALVAAPIRKLWPTNSLESRPSFESKSLVSFVNLPRVRKEPEWKVNKGPEVEKGRWDSKQATMAEMGHKLEFALPSTIVCPFLKGSVFETFNRTSIYTGEDLGMNTRSEIVRWRSGLKWESQVSSPIRRKPKKASVIAAHTIKESLLVVYLTFRRW